MLTTTNKLHFFTLLLLLASYSRAAEDYNSKQKIKESDIIKVVPVSSDNKYQHQNKRGVSDISEDIVLGSAHPGSSSYLSANTLSGFSPITSAPYSLPYSGGHLGPIYGASFYSKPLAAVPSTTFKQPFTATYPANGITFPKLSYLNTYNGYPTASYATSHHNAIAYPSIQYPSYHHGAIGGAYYHQPAYQAPIQTSVQHHGVFAQAPASPIIYGNGIHKYGLAAPVYASSDVGNVYHQQPQFTYAAVQPSYSPALVKSAIYSNVGPTVPTATIKPVVQQHSPAGGAVSFASFSQHTGSSKGPIYASPAVAPVAAYSPQYATAPHQYIVSGGYKVAASQPAQIYAQIPYTSGAVQYGTHLVQPEAAKIAYQQVQQQHHK